MRHIDQLFAYEPDACFDRTLEAVTYPSSLSSAPRIEATAWERQKAIDITKVVRTIIPLPPKITVCFRSVKGAQRGEAILENGNGLVYVNVAEVRDPDTFFRLMLHELAHISDAHTGKLQGLTQAERERRAIAFAANMMGDR